MPECFNALRHFAFMDLFPAIIVMRIGGMRGIVCLIFDTPKNRFSYVRFTLVFSLLMLLSLAGMATHNRAGEITNEHVGG